MSDKLQFDILKCHGSENDFVLLDITKSSVAFTEDMRRTLAVAVCNRESVIGADGVLFVEPSQKGDAQMRIFNSDGSEAEMCGNGLRIVGRYVGEQCKQECVDIENVTGILYHIEKENDFFDNVSAVTIQFPQADFNAALVLKNTDGSHINKKIPELDCDYRFTVLSMPNPHIVSLTDQFVVQDLIEIGQKSNADKQTFVNGANVSMVQGKSQNEIFVSTYERGVGITNSCGTAMFASVVASVKNDKLKIGEWIKVVNSGGFIMIKLNDDFSGFMTGNATYVYSAQLHFDFDNPFGFELHNRIDFTDETQSYDRLKQSLKE